jgi:hypothetical protein
VRRNLPRQRRSSVWVAFTLSVALAAPARAATPVGGACTSDLQCTLGTICKDKVCTALPRRRIVFPIYWSKPGPDGYRDVVPFYFNHWSAQPRTDVTVVPPLLYSRYQTADRDQHNVWPIFWYSKYRDGGHGAALLPLFWWSHHDQTRTFVAPLLLSGAVRNEREDISEAVVGLIGYYRRHHDDKWRVLFPLFFDHEARDRRTTVAPLSWFRRDGDRSADLVFPLIWHSRDRALGTEHLLMVPFFDWWSADHGRRARLISLFGTYDRDDADGHRQLVVFAPPVFHRTDPVRDLDVVPPLFVRWKTHDDGATGLVAGPLFSASDPEGSSTGLIPLYFRFHDKKTGAATHIIFPLAAWHHQPGARGALVGPAYGWSSSHGSGGWGAGLFPLFFFGRSGAHVHALALPLFGHVRDESTGRATTFVGPVFHRRAEGVHGWDAGLFPLVFLGHRDDVRYGYVPPLFWYRGTKDGTTGVFGPAYGYRGQRGYAGGLAPLAFFGKLDGREHQIVLPIFFRFADERAGTSRMLIGPYFHRRDGDETADVLFPLMYLRRNPREGLLLTPIAGWKRDSRRGTETLIIGPYVHTTDLKRHASTHFLFPLGVIHRSPGYDVTAQFPFFWRVHQGQETDTVVFPIYWRLRSPTAAIDGVFPLLLHTRTEVATTTILGPFWNRARHDGGRSVGLFPLFAYGKLRKEGRSSSYFGMPGVYWSKNEHAGTQYALVGPVFDVIRPDGYTAGVPPLWFGWRRGTASKMVTPIFYRQWDPAAGTAFSIFTIFYWGHTPRDRSVGILPIFFGRYRRDGSSATALLPLFYFEKKPPGRGSTLLTPLFGYSSSAIGTRAYALTIYARRDSEVSSTAVWPLFYHMRNRVTGSSTSLFLPLFFDRRSEDGHELAAYTPLIWRDHTIEASTVVGVPLFFDVHRYGESRTSGLLPFFVRNRSNATKTTWWAFPPLLAYYRDRKSGEDPGRDAVVFPLVWHFGGKNQTTVVAPLVWDFTRGTSRTTVVIPFGAHWKRSDSDHTLALNMYYKRGRGPLEGAWYVNVFPFCSFGRPRKQDLEWSLFEGLIGYSRQGRNRTLRLFFLLDIPLQPASSSSLTWFGSTPAAARTELF